MYKLIELREHVNPDGPNKNIICRHCTELSMVGVEKCQRSSNMYKQSKSRKITFKVPPQKPILIACIVFCPDTKSSILFYFSEETAS